MFLVSAIGKAPGIHSGSVSGLSSKMGRGTIIDRLITAFGKGIRSFARRLEAHADHIASVHQRDMWF
jgi:hypothetical protein